MSASDLRTEIALLDQELHALRAQIALVRAKRDRAAELLQTLAYPVLSLPNEITSELFVQYLAVDARRSPLPLTWVCRAWRDLAHRCCRLWSTFDSKFHPVDQLSFWLRHSGGRPLDLILGGMSQAKLADSYNYLAQWRTVQSPSSSLTPFFSLRGPFPTLEKLHIPFGDELSTTPTFLDAPRLREVEVWVDENHHWRGVLPWGQLTTLHLSSDSAAPFLDTAPQLEELRLELQASFVSPLPSPSTPPLILFRLRTLSLENAFCCGILQHLTLPALENFATDFEECPLLNMRLDMTYSGVDIFMELLLAVPLASLRELTLGRVRREDRGSAERLLGCLTSRNPPLLPCLESIRLEGCDFRLRLPPLVRMLTARRAGIDGVVILQSFYLSFDDDENDWDYRIARQGVVKEPKLKDALIELRRLREGGLCVEIDSDTECFTGSVSTELLALMAEEEDLPAYGLPFLLDPGSASDLAYEE
ncbi:hypothetical protein FB45DRAFT_1122635 [Roridomyces roridus]|uniref:F-box domain-containing protein n=1 Tax=Roridomyces roridus TaxID=1738132 RepID=A0AAD7B4S4_9AGAR|nr:hypothetical protein FB45DRAFT_1122635 [Roridomyces roridus]